MQVGLTTKGKQMKSYKIIFYRNTFDNTLNHHSFHFETHIGANHEEFSTLAFKQFVKSRARSSVGGLDYLNTIAFHDDGYSVGDFSDIGQLQPGINWYRTSDTPGFDNSTVTSDTSIQYDFWFYQQFLMNRKVIIETAQFHVRILGSGISSNMSISYGNKDIHLGNGQISVPIQLI